MVTCNTHAIGWGSPTPTQWRCMWPPLMAKNIQSWCHTKGRVRHVKWDSAYGVMNDNLKAMKFFSPPFFCLSQLLKICSNLTKIKSFPPVYFYFNCSTHSFYCSLFVLNLFFNSIPYHLVLFDFYNKYDPSSFNCNFFIIFIIKFIFLFHPSSS